jgi:hypothetical protein
MWSAVLFVVAMAAPAGGPFRCEATDVAGLPAADAATAVAIVCDELASVSGRSGAYSVSMRSAGESVIVSVRHAGCGRRPHAGAGRTEGGAHGGAPPGRGARARQAD